MPTPSSSDLGLSFDFLIFLSSIYHPQSTLPPTHGTHPSTSPSNSLQPVATSHTSTWLSRTSSWFSRASSCFSRTCAWISRAGTWIPGATILPSPLFLVLHMFFFQYLCTFCCSFSVFPLYFFILFIFLLYVVRGFESPWPFTVSFVGGYFLLLEFVLLDDRLCY